MLNLVSHCILVSTTPNKTYYFSMLVMKKRMKLPERMQRMKLPQKDPGYKILSSIMLLSLVMDVIMLVLIPNYSSEKKFSMKKMMYYDVRCNCKRKED